MARVARTAARWTTEMPRFFSSSIQSEVVARCAGALDRAGQVDRAAVEQELLGQRRLAGVRVRDDGEGPAARDFATEAFVAVGHSRAVRSGGAESLLDLATALRGGSHSTARPDRHRIRRKTWLAGAVLGGDSLGGTTVSLGTARRRAADLVNLRCPDEVRFPSRWPLGWPSVRRRTSSPSDQGSRPL